MKCDSRANVVLGFGTSATGSDTSWKVGDVGAPAVGVMFVYGEVLDHRMSSMPVVRRILASVPGFSVSLGFPAMVTFAFANFDQPEDESKEPYPAISSATSSKTTRTPYL